MEPYVDADSANARSSKVIVGRLVQKNLPFQTLFSFISFSLVGLSVTFVGFFFFLHRKKGLRPKLNPGSLGTSSATPSFPSFLFSVPPRADVSKRLIHHAPLSVVRQTNRSDTP